MPLETYDEQRELEEIARRYERCFASLPFTLPRLQGDAIFCNLVRRLRTEGWLDWHILQAVVNGVINWHLACMNADHDPEAMRTVGGPFTRRFLETGEAAGDTPIPLAYFDGHTVEMLLRMGILTFLKGKGAIFGQRGYDPEKLRRIVAERYHYFELDTPHPHLLPTDDQTVGE